MAIGLEAHLAQLLGLAQDKESSYTFDLSAIFKPFETPESLQRLRNKDQKSVDIFAEALRDMDVDEENILAFMPKDAKIKGETTPFETFVAIANLHYLSVNQIAKESARDARNR